jgi:hypothetical protein
MRKLKALVLGAAVALSLWIGAAQLYAYTCQLVMIETWVNEQGCSVERYTYFDCETGKQTGRVTVTYC